MRKIVIASLAMLLCPAVALGDECDAKAGAPGAEGYRLGERITLSGLIEVEGAYEALRFNQEGDSDGGEMVLATAQLAVGARLAEDVDASLVLLFEEGEAEGVEVDEAFVNCTHGGWFAVVGRQYVPFGEFPSSFVTDPLTLELGETQAAAVLGGRAAGALTLSAYAFAERGLIDEDGSRGADPGTGVTWGARVDATVMPSLDVGAGLVSDIAESDAGIAATDSKRVPGWSAYGRASVGAIEITGEAVAAVDRFQAADLDVDGDGRGDRPFAWNAEVSWSAASGVVVAGRVEGASEFAACPELRFGLCLSAEAHGGIVYSLEYLHAEYDVAFAGGDERPVDGGDRVTLQMALEF